MVVKGIEDARNRRMWESKGYPFSVGVFEKVNMGESRTCLDDRGTFLRNKQSLRSDFLAS